MKKVILLIACLTLCSCGDNSNVSKDYTFESRVINYDINSLYNELVNTIEGSYIPEGYIFNDSDIIEGALVNNYYYSNGAVYIQVDEYMYRFQLDNNYNIESYIKYVLEG